MQFLVLTAILHIGYLAFITIIYMHSLFIFFLLLLHIGCPFLCYSSQQEERSKNAVPRDGSNIFISNSHVIIFGKEGMKFPQ